MGVEPREAPSKHIIDDQLERAVVAWPDWAYAGEDGTFGNRYDDPRSEYRVLYASSRRLGTLLETLARFRPDPAIIATEIQGDSRDDAYETLAAGVVPASWLENGRREAPTRGSPSVVSQF